MKGKLLINGVELSVEIPDQDLQKILASQDEKKTGYERVVCGNRYFYDVGHEDDSTIEENVDIDIAMYDAANYYSSRDVAKNNTRADRLMRRLRRFAVTHRGTDNDRVDGNLKFCIVYDHNHNSLVIETAFSNQTHGVVYFDSHGTAVLAVEEFHDELIWYFTEYKDSL